MTSPTYLNHNDGNPNYLYGVGFGNNTSMVVGYNGKIVRSTNNGSSFSSVTSLTSNYLYGVEFLEKPLRTQIV